MATKKLKNHVDKMADPHLKLVPGGASLAKPGFTQPMNSKISSREIRKIGHKVNAHLPRYRKAG